MQYVEGKHNHFFDRVDTDPPGSVEVRLVKGKQGRVCARNGCQDAEKYFYDPSKDGPIAEDTRDKARRIATMARRAQMDGGHQFLDGENIVSLVVIDETHTPVHVYVPLAPGNGKTASGCNLLNKDAITDVIVAAHPRFAGRLEDLEQETVILYFAPFKDKDVILAFPREAVDPSLFYLLDLAPPPGTKKKEQQDNRENGGEMNVHPSPDPVMAVAVKMKDDLSCGRSRPHISMYKFNFLFPGVVLPENPAKRSRPTATADEKGVDVVENKKTKMHTDLTAKVLEKIWAHDFSDSERMKIAFIDHFFMILSQSPLCDRAIEILEKPCIDPKTAFHTITDAVYLRSVAKMCGVEAESHGVIDLITKN